MRNWRESSTKSATARFRSRPVLVGLTVLLAIASAVFVRQRVLNIRTAALVNGERIWVEQIDNRIESLKAKEPARFRVDPDRQKELGLRKQMIDALVQLRIISQAARTAGISVSEEDIDRELALRAGAYESESAFYGAMADEGYSARVLRDEARDLLAQQKMREKLAREVAVGEHEIDSYIAARKEKLETQARQVRLTEVKVTGKEQALEVSKGEEAGRVAARAKKLNLPVQRYWQRQDLLAYKLNDAILQTGPGGIVGSLPQPDNTLSLYEVHQWRERVSGEDELRSQVKRKLLWDKQEASFGQWVKTIERLVDVRIFN